MNAEEFYMAGDGVMQVDHVAGAVCHWDMIHVVLPADESAMSEAIDKLAELYPGVPICFGSLMNN